MGVLSKLGDNPFGRRAKKAHNGPNTCSSQDRKKPVQVLLSDIAAKGFFSSRNAQQKEYQVSAILEQERKTQQERHNHPVPV